MVAATPFTGLVYFVERLPGERGQMYADLVSGGRIESTYAFGSPAPYPSVLATAVEFNRASAASRWSPN